MVPSDTKMNLKNMNFPLSSIIYLKSSRWRAIIPQDLDEDDVSEEEEEEDDDDEEEIQQRSNSSTTNLCGIIFVEHRYTAAIMSRLLKKFAKKDPDLRFILCSCISIGSGRLGIVKRSVAQMKNQCRKHEEVLRKFRRREINVLVATSSVEEGIGSLIIF